MTILQTFNIQYTDQEESLLKSISDADKLDEILVAITKSQGQKFHELMHQLSQTP
jgi:hypothetical protein